MTYGFDPWNPAFVAHPYEVYAALREHEPVAWFEPTQQWLVSRHADVNALLRDRRLGRTYLHVGHARGDRPSARPAAAARRSGTSSATACSTWSRPTTPGCAGWSRRRSRRARGRALRPTVQRIADEAGRRRSSRQGGGDLIADGGRAAAGHGHRGDARRAGGGPAPAAAVVGRHLRDVRAEPVRGDAAATRSGVRGVLRVPARSWPRSRRTARATTSSPRSCRSPTRATGSPRTS